MSDNIKDSNTINRFPILELLTLAMTVFTAIMTETLPAGLLPQIGKSLEVPESLAFT